jgi:RNA polymerase sigma factor (sigma-70 family)
VEGKAREPTKSPQPFRKKFSRPKYPSPAPRAFNTVRASHPPLSAPPTSSDPIAATETSRWFTEEVHAHDSALKDYLRRAFPQVSDVEDVVQESYLRIWRQRAVEPIRSARAFLFTVAQRIAIDGLRRRRRSPVASVGSLATLDVPDGAPATPERIGHEEKIELLIAAIDALPARCREVVVLRKLKTCSQRDTALQLGISEKGVEIQLARGLERCRDFLRRRGTDHLFRHDA